MKKLVVSIVGGALVVAGAVLMPLPGPGFLIVVAGLAVLATQYAWARRLVERSKSKAVEAQRAAVQSPLRCAVTLMTAACALALGVVMITVDDILWPLWDSVLDALWSPVTGGVIVGTGVLLVVTTLVTLARERGHTGRSSDTARHRA